MPAIYIFVYYRVGLYADFGIQIYYLLAAVYGFVMWYFQSDGTSAEDKYTAKPHYLDISKIKLCLVSFVLWMLLGGLLKYFTDSNVPFYDGFTTALSIVGLWMLSRKYIEQWIVWAVVDAVCFGLYIYKGIYATSVLYALYTVIAIFGYRKWKGMMQ